MLRASVSCMVLLVCACADEGAVPPSEDRSDKGAFAQPRNDGESEPQAAGEPPKDPTPVSEGPIDPKSPQGAGQVVQSFAALLEQGRLEEAGRLWSGGEPGWQEFAEKAASAADIHAEVGAPGEMQGAAGSVYVEVPLRLYGRRPDGAPFRSSGIATLRRANDVPGSTAEQRRWRIYRIDVQPPL